MREECLRLLLNIEKNYFKTNIAELYFLFKPILHKYLKGKYDTFCIDDDNKKMFIEYKGTQYDFCEYIIEYIEDYTKFKNDLLFYLLKEI